MQGGPFITDCPTVLPRGITDFSHQKSQQPTNSQQPATSSHQPSASQLPVTSHRPASSQQSATSQSPASSQPAASQQVFGLINQPGINNTCFLHTQCHRYIATLNDWLAHSSCQKKWRATAHHYSTPESDRPTVLVHMFNIAACRETLCNCPPSHVVVY